MANNYSPDEVRLNKMFTQLDTLKYSLMAGLVEADIDEDQWAWDTHIQSSRYVVAPLRHQRYKLLDPAKQIEEQNATKLTNKHADLEDDPSSRLELSIGEDLVPRHMSPEQTNRSWMKWEWVEWL